MLKVSFFCLGGWLWPVVGICTAGSFRFDIWSVNDPSEIGFLYHHPSQNCHGGPNNACALLIEVVGRGFSNATTANVFRFAYFVPHSNATCGEQQLFTKQQIGPRSITRDHIVDFVGASQPRFSVFCKSVGNLSLFCVAQHVRDSF